MSELTEQVRAYFSAMGKKGGSVKGVSKARTREQAQRAVNARWKKYRLAKKESTESEKAPIRMENPEIAP
jgi:hypothetical protein